MTLPRNIKFLLLSLALLVVLAFLAAWLCWEHAGRYVAGVHQRSVTHSLAKWSGDYACVTNDASAVAAAEMIGYMSHYYIPGPGYRGPANVEAALERQRGESIRRVADALRQYTGLDYGTNAERWTDWAELRKKELGRAGNSEPRGAANGSQPFRTETNQTSSAAGFRRR